MLITFFPSGGTVYREFQLNKLLLARIFLNFCNVVRLNGQKFDHNIVIQKSVPRHYTESHLTYRSLIFMSRFSLFIESSAVSTMRLFSSPKIDITVGKIHLNHSGIATSRILKLQENVLNKKSRSFQIFCFNNFFFRHYFGTLLVALWIHIYVCYMCSCPTNPNICL